MTTPHPFAFPEDEPLSIPEQCEALGRILGLNAPVSEEVLQAAVGNPTYADNLLICRRNPALLQRLLTHPPRRKATFTAAELALCGAKAVLRWAGTGFTVVDGATYARRLAGCGGCPNLASAPEERELLYKVVGVGPGDRAICRVCGCSVRLKARLSSESCPTPDPAQADYSRWQEPLHQG